MTTRKIGLSALMTAVYVRITTDILTSGYSTYNFIPKTGSEPYIRIGGAMGSKSEYDNRTSPVEDNSVHVHVWSVLRSDKECLDMMNNIAQAITASSLSITGYQTPIQARLEFYDCMTDDSLPTTIRRHGVMRFSFDTTPT